MNPSTELARWVVAELLDRGVTDAVICPGSRNAPLLFAFADSPIRLHSRIDERTAGFLALGIAKTSRRPVAVVTTSGTASANLHPAVLEAAHAGVPLIAITADRPASLRGTGANQTTNQRGLFGDAVPSLDLTAPTSLSPAPLHLNVQFEDPLTPGPGASRDSVNLPTGDLKRAAADSSRSSIHELPLGPRTVVVAGDDAGPAARILAETAGWPLLAEPTSGSRNGSALRTYRLLLAHLGDEVERAVVFGHPTLSRPVARLLARVPVISVRARGRWPKRPFPIIEEYDELVAAPDTAGHDWLSRWQRLDESLGRKLDEAIRDWGFTPYDVAREVSRAVPAGGLLMVGASNPIRDLDLMADPYPVHERRMIIANRGLAGIDGTISTAIGAVLGRPHSTRAIAYLGDVTFLHDLNGLLIGPGEDRPDLSIVVANDDGGSIFATLEQGDASYSQDFEKLFGTPHGSDIARLCQGYAVPHRRVESAEQLREALATPTGGIEVIEASITRVDRRAWDEQLRALTVD